MLVPALSRGAIHTTAAKTCKLHSTIPAKLLPCCSTRHHTKPGAAAAQHSTHSTAQHSTHLQALPRRRQQRLDQRGLAQPAVPHDQHLDELLLPVVAWELMLWVEFEHASRALHSAAAQQVNTPSTARHRTAQHDTARRSAAHAPDLVRARAAGPQQGGLAGARCSVKGAAAGHASTGVVCVGGVGQQGVCGVVVCVGVVRCGVVSAWVVVVEGRTGLDAQV